VGNNLPKEGGATHLRYADDDAVATHRLLREAGVDSTLLVRLDEDSRALYPDLKGYKAPRLDELERAFSRVSERINTLAKSKTNAELLIFYSGHGDVEQGEGFVVFEDGRLSRSALYAMLARSPATQNHVFVDACKSYYMAFERGAGGERIAFTEPFVRDGVPSHITNTGFVLSTSSDRDSHEWEKYQAGILSHELRSALRGAADVNDDGRVTYAELGAFLSTANRSIPNPRFRPIFTVRAPQHDLKKEVFEWKGDEASLRVVGSTLGHIYVETSSGERVLDAHPAAQQLLSLHVPSERPLFVRNNDESTEYVVTSLAPVRLETLPSKSLEIGRRGALNLAFERLFAAPFSEHDVTSFVQQQVSFSLVSSTPKDTPSTKPVLRNISGAVALGAAVGGLSLGVISYATYRGGEGKSQQEIEHRNHVVRELNIASATLFAVAGVTGVTWGLLKFLPDSSLSVSPSLAHRGEGSGVFFEWAQRY
jgi:hypothetical protein